LADSFSRAQRGRVLSVFNMAIPVGAALGYIVGGLMSNHFGWRSAFFVAGAPGLLLAALAWRLKYPPRGSQDESEEGDATHIAERKGNGVTRPAADSNGASGSGAARGAITVYLDLLKRAPYLLVVLGYAAYTFALGGLAVWMPFFLEHVHHVPAVQATTSFGAIVVVTGFLGTFAGGWLGDYLQKSSRQAYLWMSGWVTLIAAPLAFVALTVASPSVYYPAIIAAELLLFMSTGPINSAIANLVSPMERASAFALSMFVIHLLGDVPSPTLIGWVYDSSSLEKAVLMVPVAIVISGIVWLVSARVSARASAGHPGL
jgi:sugar phosphate permease